MDPQAIFNAAYWASKSPAINAGRSQNFDDISGGPLSSSPRWRYYAQLGAVGESVDVPIMIWGWDPWNIMVLRESFGYAYVPASNGSVIKVSTNPADYKPYGTK